MKYKFEIGDLVKLKSGAGYPKHEGEIATLISPIFQIKYSYSTVSSSSSTVSSSSTPIPASIIATETDKILGWTIEFPDGNYASVNLRDLIPLKLDEYLGKKVVCVDGFCKGSKGIVKNIGKIRGMGKNTSIWSDWGTPGALLTFLDISVLEMEK